jgi:hypothetical protein
MRPSELALVQGLSHTRSTLERWNAAPWRTLRGWLAGSLAVALLLLLAVLVVADNSTVDPTPFHLPGYDSPPHASDVLRVLFRNGLVLALHSMACVAGFIAGSSLPLQAERYNGWYRKLHDHAGRAAILFVSCATLFSLSTQGYILGGEAATLAGQLGISPAKLLLVFLPHAIPELVALFLPLAAWLIASRRGDWHELLAATFVTTAIAIPVLVLASLVEVYVSPKLLWLVTNAPYSPPGL